MSVPITVKIKMPGGRLTLFETRYLPPGKKFSVENIGGKIHVGSVHTPDAPGARPAIIARNSGEGYYKEGEKKNKDDSNDNSISSE